MTQPKERTLALSANLRVRTFDEGTGPVVLLLHGNPDNADEWRHLLPLLSPEFRCIAPDLPGYGPRGATYDLPATYDYSVAAQVGFVDEVLQALGVGEKLTLVVHDIGGIMGVPWAAQNLARLHSVIYTNTVAFPRFGWFPLARLFGSRGRVMRWVASQNMGLLGRFGGRVFRSQFGKQNPQLNGFELERITRDFALNPVAKETTLRQFRQITRLDFFDGYELQVKAIAGAVPTVTLWGDGDPYLETSFAQQLYARETRVLPGVGHWVPIVAAEQVASAVRALRAQPGTGAH